MQAHGWSYLFTAKSGTHYVRRPGKKHGVSATVNYRGWGGLYVFSSSTEFEMNKGYLPSTVYTILECNSDHKIAYKRLVSEGYGKIYERGVQSPLYSTPIVDGVKQDHLEPSPEPIAELDPHFIIDCLYRNQQGDALLLQRLTDGKLAYDAATRCWCVFNSPLRLNHWAIDRQSYAIQVCAHILESAYSNLGREYRRQIEEYSENQQPSRSDVDRAATINQHIAQINKRIDKLHTIGYVKNVLEYSQTYLSIAGDNWDSDPTILGVANGIVDLTTGELRAAKPRDYVRAVSPTRYNPEATYERFEQFICEINSDDKQVIEYMHRLLGYGITGLSTHHIHPILWGSHGRNGKDTLVDIIQYTLGNQIAKSVSADLIIASGTRSSGAATPELYDLWGCRIAWINETDEGARVRAGQLKALSGGSSIKCRPLHGNMVEFKPTHLLMLLTNDKPNIPAIDTALWQRVQLIPFKNRFIDNPDPEKPNEYKVDRDLPQKLRSESEGVLNWLVKGATKFFADRQIPLPQSLRKETEVYQADSDTIKDFFDEFYTFSEDPLHVEKLYEMYKKYTDWCSRTGIYSSSLRSFSTWLSKMSVDMIKKNDGKYVRGIITKTRMFNTDWA